jgi:hypothetical protein
MNEKIQFKKQRDIGEIITDTFKFIREEWKPLGTLILKITGPALFVLVSTRKLPWVVLARLTYLIPTNLFQ